eukprot:1380212-Amorphochlora_amoeboformis.AAC.1
MIYRGKPKLDAKQVLRFPNLKRFTGNSAGRFKTRKISINLEHSLQWVRKMNFTETEFFALNLVVGPMIDVEGARCLSHPIAPQ